MKILFYLFPHIRSFQRLLYHYELNANGFYLLLYIKVSRDIYQKVCFGNNTYSGILTDFYHSFFLGVVPTMNNMQSKRQWLIHRVSSLFHRRLRLIAPYLHRPNTHTQTKNKANQFDPPVFGFAIVPIQNPLLVGTIVTHMSLYFSVYLFHM